MRDKGDPFPGEHRPGDGAAVEKRRNLTRVLLRSATQGLPSRDFLPEVSRAIMEFSDSDAVELWVREDEQKHYRCSVTRFGEMPFGFILVPCPLGEETAPPPETAEELGMEILCCNVIRGVSAGPWMRLTPKGAFFLADTENALSPPEVGSDGPGAPALHLPTSYRSLALIPIPIEGQCIGLMQLKSVQGHLFPPEDMALYEEVAEILGFALTHHYAHIELRERIKELTCLYEIAQVIGHRELSFDEVIQCIADLLPPAWLYPEIACARISVNGDSYSTVGFEETAFRQSSEIVVAAKPVGAVEVFYRERRITLDEGPFLAEERSLIDNIARKVANFCELVETEREKARLEDQLRHADRLATIGQLAAGVAHELNEPLGNMLGFAQLARKAPELPGQVAQDLKRIESAGLHAREIIKKLMVFSRQLPPRKVPVDPNALIDECLYFFEDRCSKSGIQLLRKLARGLPRITVDPGQLNQVLVNLVVNAIQAMPEGGILTVETRASREEMVIAVGDTGTGIGEDIKDKVFMPFFTTKDVKEGTGLGLAVAHGIISSHKGTIELRSKPGSGTRFIIRLPQNATVKLG